MTTLTHCDAPNCEETKNEDDLRVFSTPRWLEVNEGSRKLDFHSHQCLRLWSDLNS